MFEERRTNEKVGVDKSYPLKPISGNDRISKTNGESTTRAPLKARVGNGNITTRTTPKATPLDNDHIRHDRDPLNNTIGYNSANRVPALNKIATNNHINGNGVGARKPAPAAPKVTSAERPKVDTVTRRSAPSSTASSNASPKKEASSAGVKLISVAPPKKETPVPPPEGMAQCKICFRNFLEERIAKHETVCSKMATKKRKVFDATKHRVAVSMIFTTKRSWLLLRYSPQNKQELIHFGWISFFFTRNVNLFKLIFMKFTIRVKI